MMKTIHKNKLFSPKKRLKGALFLEVRRLEPLTYGLQSHRSSQLSYTP